MVVVWVDNHPRPTLRVVASSAGTSSCQPCWMAQELLLLLLPALLLQLLQGVGGRRHVNETIIAVENLHTCGGTCHAYEWSPSGVQVGYAWGSQYRWGCT